MNGTQILAAVAHTFHGIADWGTSCPFYCICSYIADEIYKRPVIIYKQPKQIKPFYVRLNDDGKTVAAFDVILPKVRLGHTIR